MIKIHDNLEEPKTLQDTADCSLKQPKQKRPRSLSLPACKVAIGGSKSVENTIFQQRPLGATS